jgi:hypothetical protein
MSSSESVLTEAVAGRFPPGSYVRIVAHDCHNLGHLVGTVHKVAYAAMCNAPPDLPVDSPERYMLRLEDRSLIGIKHVERVKKQKTEF